MKKIKQFILAGFMVMGIGAVALPATVGAIDVFPQCTNNSAKDTAVCGSANKDEAESLVKNIINLLLYVVGAVSVVVIIAAGLMYVTSTGDSGRVTKAKNMLMYAVIGLVVAFLSYAIVNFVLFGLETGTSN